MPRDSATHQFSLLYLSDDMVQLLMLVVDMIGITGLLQLEMAQQVLRGARVLAKHKVGLLQHIQCAKRNVFKVSDGSGDNNKSHRLQMGFEFRQVTFGAEPLDGALLELAHTLARKVGAGTDLIQSVFALGVEAVVHARGSLRSALAPNGTSTAIST